MFGAIGCIIAIAIMIYAVFKGLHPLIAALVATVIAIATNSAPLWETLMEGFSGGMVGFVKSWMIMFFMGAAFGEFMSRSGFAKSIAYKLVDIFGASRGILVVTVATWVLNYSGVSVFVIIFAIYPIALYVFQQGDIPRRIIPGVANLGAGTLTMTMLPGSPALTNVIPTNYLGTDIYAAPVLGCILSVVAAVLGLSYLNWQVAVWKKNGEHFTPGANDVVEPITEEARKDVPSFALAIIPVLLIFFGNLVGTRVLGLNSTFAVCISLFIGTLYAALFTIKKTDAKGIQQSLNKAASGAIVAILNTAAIVGFAGAVQNMGSFQNFLNLATSLKFTPLLSAVLAMDIICGITASSSGGVTIFMELLGQKFVDMGVNVQQLHRLTSVAAGTLDSLPHAGPNATFMAVCGLTYKEGYFPVFVITCIIPLICQFLGVGLALLGVC